MKITANLLPSRPRAALPLAIALWAISTILVAIAISLVASTMEMRAEHPRLESRLARLKEQLKSSAPRETLPPPTAMDATRQRVSALNTLAGVRGWGTSQLLSWLESRLPNNVRLVSLHHKPRDGEILIIAESAHAEALTGFLLKLEKEPRFSDVLLSKQGVRGQGDTLLQFEIRVRQTP